MADGESRAVDPDVPTIDILRRTVGRREALEEASQWETWVGELTDGEFEDLVDGD